VIGRLLLGLAPLFLLAGAAGPADAASRCDAGVARRASVVEIVMDFEAWRGRCVAVTAASEGTMLFAGVEALYAVDRTRVLEAAPDRVRDARIGLVARLPHRRLHRGAIARVTAIGRVEDCQSLYNRAQVAAGEATISTRGYCSVERGPVILVEELSVERPLRLERLTGEQARADHGDLGRLFEEWPRLAESEAMAAAFLAALRSGDRGALARLHLGSFDREGGREEADYVLSRGSPFAAVARLEGLVQTRLFIRFGLLGTLGPESVPVTTCFCRVPDCSDRWPIAEADADNAAERPYACTRIEAYDPGGRPERVFVTRPLARSLAEPRRTAFRR
jgi:hypothetical protein